MRETIEAHFDSRKEESSRNDRRNFFKSTSGQIDTPLKMVLAIRFGKVLKISVLMRASAHPPTTFGRSIEFLHRNTVPILFAIFIAMWGWRAMTPKQLFATEEERARVLSAAGAPSSTRIIVLGTEWCPACTQLKYKLTTDNIPHLALDVENNPAAGELFRRAVEIDGSRSVPKIVFDKDIVSQPKLFMELARGDGGR
jgi:glutaredoxin